MPFVFWECFLRANHWPYCGTRFWRLLLVWRISSNCRSAFINESLELEYWASLEHVVIVASRKGQKTILQVPLQWFPVRFLWSTFNCHGQGAIGSSIRSTTSQTWSYGSVHPHHPSAWLPLSRPSLTVKLLIQTSNPLPLQKTHTHTHTLLHTNYINHK